MNIFVDADACPVKDIIIKTAKEFSIPVYLFVDTSHILSDSYSTVITVDKASDSVDFAIANRIHKGDIAVTQDYGLASMLLAKGAYVVHQNGFLYDENNIDRLLFERHISKEMRRQGKRGGRFHARKEEDNIRFASCFCSVCRKAVEEES